MSHLVILFPRYYYERKMSCYRRHETDALLSLSSDTMRVTLTGQGWPSYNEGKTLLANLKQLQADAVVWYKPQGTREVPALKDPHLRDGIPATSTYNEAWWPRRKAWRECRDTDTTRVVCHHVNDLPRFVSQPTDTYSVEVKHEPHCASDLFERFSRPWEDRDIDVLVVGVLSREIYPLRTQVAHLIKEGEIAGVVREHPGYRLSSIQQARAQENEYAAMLGRSKVVVCCSSIYGYGLSKYVEAMRAGAHVAGDIPPDYEHLASHMTALHRGLSPRGYALSLSHAVRHGEEQAASGQQAVRELHDMTAYAERLAGFCVS